MDRINNAIRQLKLRDFIAPLIFLLMLVPSWAFRLLNKVRRRRLWLVSEQGGARDNGYHFYKYVRENHPKDFCYYAVKYDSAGYNKVVKLGNIVKYGSLRHWLYYMSANLNISSQKSGNPSPIFWYILHVKLGLYDNRVFLQHGITKDNSKWLYYNQTHFKYFVCGVKREYNYILEKFGYKKEQLLLTGFPRWDNLRDTSEKQSNKSILIMPTWRNWLGGERNRLFETKDFLNTDFYKNWSDFLNNGDFIKYIEKNNIIAYFFPHINMYPFIKYFKSPSKNIKIVSKDEDIQGYFDKCKLMITDYSSVAFDFAYLRKPVIYYQFDIKEYRKKQYQEGYFNYKSDGFGPVVENEKDLTESIKKMMDCDLNDKYEKRSNDFFVSHSDSNTECLYNMLVGKKKKIKVMHVVNGMNIGGIETFIMNVYRKIDRDKYEFVFLTNKSGKYDYQEEVEMLGGRFVKIDSVKPGKRIRHLIQVNNAIKRERPDVVHCHTYFDSATVMLAAKHNHVKIRITHSHTTEGCSLGRKALHSFLALIIRCASTDLVACSKEAGNALYKKGDFKIIDNGIDVQKFLFDASKRNKYRKEFGFSDSDIVIGHVGRLVKIKNHEYLLKILKELDDFRYKMAFVGDGELRKHLEDEARRGGINERVLFLGNKSDVGDMYNMFDIFLFPSIYEGLGMVLVEAQANGLPIVASSVVPAIVKMNPNVVFKKLSDDTRSWRDAVLMMDKTRIAPSEKIWEYSIDGVVKSLERLYGGA